MESKFCSSATGSSKTCQISVSHASEIENQGSAEGKSNVGIFSVIARKGHFVSRRMTRKWVGGRKSGLVPTDIGQLYRMLEIEREGDRKGRRDGE